MGGNALKFNTVRLHQNEFIHFEKFIVERLTPHFNQVNPTLYFQDKKTFGDLDVIVTGQQGKQSTTELINSLFRPNEIFKNGNVYSFDVSNFQVDLIFFGKEVYETAKFYYSYNDLNNLVGKLYHHFNLKFGHKGLAFKMFADDLHYQKEITLSRNPKQIYELIDLDYSKYEQGFNSLIEIFEFIISSKYFDPALFSLKNLKHKDRTRDRKRKTYSAFLSYIEEKLNVELLKVDYKHKIDLDETYSFIDTNFPEVDIYSHIEKLERVNDERKLIAKKFNGNIVRELTGREGKEIGDLIKALKSEKDFKKFVLNASQSHINQAICDFDQKLKYEL